MHTARIIQVLPEMDQLNESARGQSDASRVMRLRQQILEEGCRSFPASGRNHRADRQRDKTWHEWHMPNEVVPILPRCSGKYLLVARPGANPVGEEENGGQRASYITAPQLASTRRR
jgi:hypothetical protein